MGGLNWIVVLPAVFAPILMVTEKARLSILILCCLLSFFLVRLVVAYRCHNKLQRWNRHARQVNDSLYELYKPEGVPTMEVLFFHGLPFGDFSETHLSTWENADGSCIWPKSWLAEEFPEAHILVVSYGEGLKEGPGATFDMRIISENLTNDLIQANIGQSCPVVLVGHSFGGLVIKKLCLEAQKSSISPSDMAKVKKFLDNLRGVFYYGTPHRGSPHIGRAATVLSGPLFEYFTTLSFEAGRLNFDFHRLRNSYPKWKLEGLGEMLPVKTGLFQGILIVPEASARDGDKFNLESADHFSVCRPKTKSSRRFNALTTLLHNISDNWKEEIKRQDKACDEKKATAQKQAIRQNLQHLPNQIIGMDVLLEQVTRQLEKCTTLGFVGMGGLGKTTLAKAVFNELSPTFEYSCFVHKVKLIGGTDEEVKAAIWTRMHHNGRKVRNADDWSDLRGKQILLILDDISKECDLLVLSELVDGPSSKSRCIVTSRDKNLLSSLDGIFEVPLLDKNNAQKLFMSHAFPNQAVPSHKLAGDIVAVVEKCSGLPLTLEVLGKYLKMQEDVKFWKQTFLALDKAEAIQDLDERLWAKLRLSYEGLKEVEQQMFLDATTFFASYFFNVHVGVRTWSLREAKAAWRKAYQTNSEDLRWRTLVDRSLVYDVEENEGIKVHDQLLSLGRKIASQPTNNGKCRIWDKTLALKLLPDNEESENQDIHSLRLSYKWDGRQRKEIHISCHALHKLKKLQYLEVDGPLGIDGAKEDRKLPSQLVLLRCVELESIDLALQDGLVVLHLSHVKFLPSSIGQLSALRILTGTDLESLPDEFGDLSQLEYLEFRNCHKLGSLPETFGKLSKLQHLRFQICFELQSLPDTFGKLSQLESLTFIRCCRLQSLPEAFGNLLNLKDLKFYRCSELHTLPQSFGHLSALEHLEVSNCPRLCALPNSFGNLSALKQLEIRQCTSLHALPDSFGNLLVLEDLKLEFCQFEALPDSFGKLSTLTDLKLFNCGNLPSVIPFGQCAKLQYLEVTGSNSPVELEKLPDSLGELTVLSYLILRSIGIRNIPDHINSMQSLQTLELCALPYVKELPTWLGETGAAPLALSHKIFRVQDGHFSLTREETTQTAQGLIQTIHEIALEKVRETAYEAALAALCPANLGVLEPKLQRFLLQERAIVRRFMGDVQGALEDLTGALEVFSEADDGHYYMYDCWKHRGYVNYLLGDLDGAQNDGAMAVKLLPEYDCTQIVRSPSLGENSVAYMDFRLLRRREKVEKLWELMDSSHSQVMDMVRMSDLQGALACWDSIDARAYSLNLRLFFLQERGILKRLAGDLHGALEDLTAALEIYAETKDLRESERTGVEDYAYNCWKHRGSVKFLLGDWDGARKDGNRALKFLAYYEFCRRESLISVPSLGEELVVYMHFKLYGTIGLEKQKKLQTALHYQVMEMVRISDFSRALKIWENLDARVEGCFHQVFFLQERGVLKRLAGDLQGALQDLTATLEILSEGDCDCRKRGFWRRRPCWHQFTYNCLKHRGYVNFLLGDLVSAENDGAKALKLLCGDYNHIWVISPSLGEESVTYMHFTLIGKREVNQERDLLHSQVIEKVKTSDFQGALAIWDDLDSRVFGFFERVYFLQERGILRRMAGDLQGALEDLTTALGVLSEGDCDGCVRFREPPPCCHQYRYNCRKHRGYVHFLLEDLGGAQNDGGQALKLLCDYNKHEWRISAGGVGEEPATYMHFRLLGKREVDEQMNLMWRVHSQVMGKVRTSDFAEALRIWDAFDARVSGYFNQFYFLQERGILKRMAGDLHGALADLTAAGEIADDSYECFKNRGYIKYLMGDVDGARRDAERCMAMEPTVDGRECLGGSPVAFMEFRLKGRKKNENLLLESANDDVMEKVKALDFVGALAIWDDFDGKVSGFYDRPYFLQERGILKRMAGDLQGALEDLTASLEIGGSDYDCFKHRAYVKHLMGDQDGARRDAERCMSMKRGEVMYEYLGGFPVAFLEFALK